MRFQYVTASGVSHNLDGNAVFSGIAKDFRSYEWSYSLGAKRVTSLVRNARKIELTLYALSISEADDLRRAFEKDVISQTPGQFVADGYYQRAYIVAGDLDHIHETADTLTAKFDVILLDGYWRKPLQKSFVHTAKVQNDYLDYPYDYAHDYGVGFLPSQVETDSLEESPVIITIYGAAVNPYIDIGSNRYQVNVTVPAGGYLVIDGVNHTITLFDMYGNPQNVFDSGVRGTGAGGGSYVFETLKPGASSVTWPSGFGFDLEYYLIEGVPRWSR